LRMQRRALHVAVPEVEFLGLPSRLAGKRVVLRHAPIVVQTDHRAGVVIRALRALHLPALAEREIEIAVAVEDDAPAEVDAARAFRALPEQHLHVLQLLAVQLCAGELGSDAAFAACGVCEINQPVLTVPRVENDIEKPALPSGGDLRQPRNRLGIELPPRNDTQPPGSLGNEHAAVGQECKRPRMLQALYDGCHVKGMFLGPERGRAHRLRERSNWSAVRCCSSGCSRGPSLSFFPARWHSPISWRTPGKASGRFSTAGSWRRFTASCSSISPQQAAGPGASTVPGARPGRLEPCEQTLVSRS